MPQKANNKSDFIVLIPIAYRDKFHVALTGGNSAARRVFEVTCLANLRKLFRPTVQCFNSSYFLRWTTSVVYKPTFYKCRIFKLFGTPRIIIMNSGLFIFWNGFPRPFATIEIQLSECFCQLLIVLICSKFSKQKTKRREKTSYRILKEYEGVPDYLNETQVFRQRNISFLNVVSFKLQYTSS